MKAVIEYYITDELKRELAIEREERVEKKQAFIFDTKEIEGSKEILKDIAFVNEDEELPYFYLTISCCEIGSLITKENVLDILKKEKEFRKKVKLFDELNNRLYEATRIKLAKYVNVHDSDIQSIRKKYEELQTNYEIIKPMADEIQAMIDNVGNNFGKCCVNMQNSYVGKKYIEKFLEKPERAKEVYSEYKEKYQKILEERKQQKELFIKDRIARGFNEEEAEEIVNADFKERFEVEKRLWAEKFGSERLKKGIKDGYNMNRVYHMERYTKEYGKGELTDIWKTKASNPSLECLEKLEELKSRYYLDDIEVVWGDNKGEAVEIDADWAKKYWFLEG